MNRAQKEEQLNFLKDALSDVRGVVLTSVKGLSVSEVSDLRRKLHDAGIHYKVVKNTLARKAIEGTDLSVLNDDFKEETAIAWSNADAVTPAKVVVDFKKEVEKFTIKAGYASGERLDTDAVETLSKLPTLPELRSKILGLMQAVPTKLVQQINAPAQNVVGVVAAQKKKLEESA